MKIICFIIPFLLIGMTQLSAKCEAYPSFVSGHLTVSDGWVREMPKSRQTTAGYLTLHNRGKMDRTFIKVTSTFSEKSELHLMKEEYGVMKMLPLSDGIIIPSGSKIHLKPGGMHIMFLGNKVPLKVSEKHKINIMFQNKENMVIEMCVKNLTAINYHDVD